MNTCEWCGCKISSTAKYCSTKCFKDYQYKSYINRWMIGLESGLKGSGCRICGQVKRFIKQKYGNKCSRCGWAKANPQNNIIYLEIEHIDGNSLNNKEENLDLICPNCHSLTPTYKALNIGKGNKDRLKYSKLGT